jgi:hypothetical protein
VKLAPFLVAVAVAGTAAMGVHAEPGDVERIAAAGETLLAAGDLAGAEAAFERGSALTHSAELETSLVRTYLQGGQYRRALAFAAHAAGAHREYPRAAALYAWLLYLGGQQLVAGHTLDAVPAVFGADEHLNSVRESLARQQPIAAGPLLEPPARLAPYSTSSPTPAAVVGSATLVDGGRRALALAEGIDTATEVWVRNGLGETVRAVLERRHMVAGVELALLRLDIALPAPVDLASAGRAPFAGSVAYAVAFMSTPHAAQPAWPLLRLGFVGRAATTNDLPSLGIIDQPLGARGGPVFDAAGRLVGIHALARDGSERLVAAASLPPELASFGIASLAAPTPRMALDLLYERSLLLALQVVVSAPHD